MTGTEGGVFVKQDCLGCLLHVYDGGDLVCTVVVAAVGAVVAMIQE